MRLGGKPVRGLPGEQWLRRAAVAIVLRGPSAEEAEVLFIERAHQDGDPWSGDMAFPGGRVGRRETAHQGALRETQEEIGLDLLPASTRGLGELPHLLAPTHRRTRPMAVVPHVFELERAAPTLTLNHEVRGTIWIPLRWFRERTHRMRLGVRLGRIELGFPSYLVEGRVIWGLSLKMLDALLLRLC